MRTIKLNLLLLFLFTGCADNGITSGPDQHISRMLKSSPTKEDQAKISILVKNGLKSLAKSKYDFRDVIAYIDSAVSYCEKKNIDTPPALHLLRAEYNFATGDYSNSEEEGKLSEGKAGNSGDNEIYVKALLFLGKYYQRTGFYQESIDYFDKCITFSKSRKLKGFIPLAYEGKANLKRSVGDTKGYRDNMSMMAKEAISEKDSFLQERGLYFLGTSMTEKVRNFVKADSLLKKCLEISLIRKDTFYTAVACANLGWNFYSENMYDSSLYYYERSLKFSLPGRQMSTSGNSLGNIGNIYRDRGDYDKAVKYYSKSIDFARKVNDWYGLSWVYNDMSLLFLRKNDTVRAFNYYVLYKQFNDSLLTQNNAQGLSDARIRYEADAHNKEVALLSLKLKNNRLLNLGFTGLFILTIAIAFLIIRGSQHRAKRRISEMNQKMAEITQANLRQQMNPHFIFNTLNSIQYYMYQHDKIATNNYLTKFSSLMRKVLENSQQTSIPLRDELDALTLYLDLECLRFKDKFDYRITVDEEIDPLLFKIPTMLIQPYVENSICHGLVGKEQKGYVNIDLKPGADHIICTIEDNGIGREAALERKKMKGPNHNSLGTQIASSRLDLVNALYGTSLKTIYTDLKDAKGEAIGTRVEIHIPIIA
jgi:tetratricopeptide (TPR) repeat protein